MTYRAWNTTGGTVGTARPGVTGAMQGQSGGSSSSSSSWANKYKNSKNPWDAALKEAYGATAEPSDGSGTYTSSWNSALADAQKLTGRDYTADLNELAQGEIDKEKTDQGNELGSIGMRELGLRADVQDDWAERRTKASTQAAIDAQGMETSALETLTSIISGASGYELDNIAADLARAKAMVEAASAGASTAQDWEEMVAEILAKYSD